MISKVGFFTTKEVYMEQNPVFPNGQNQRTFEPFRCKKVAINARKRSCRSKTAPSL